ncbi:MAG: hypothetical protein M3020_19150 [Myxococcota bacterium]|nr:hypothetical protein [Myxococcota bacterium]
MALARGVGAVGAEEAPALGAAKGNAIDRGAITGTSTGEGNVTVSLNDAGVTLVQTWVNGDDEPERCDRAERSRFASVSPVWYFFGVTRSARVSATPVARTIRFPTGLRDKIAADAERCGRSFEGQVISLLRRHYGEDVDIAPSPAEILAMATGSLAGIPVADVRLIERKLKARER